MHYKFPEIRTINDVLPHIAGRDEFVVAEREGYTVINYAVSMEDTFPPVHVAGGSAKMRAERALTNAIRRECRGLIFYPDGHIMSRPLHKFFNLGEKEETLPQHIDFSQPHVIMEKLDGSMIRPLIVNGQLRLGTKMGVTEVAMNAETWLAAQGGNANNWLWQCIENGVTPIFEWCSRKNQIVIDYPEDNLVLLACRHNISGEYFMPTVDECPFDIVPQYGSIQGNLDEYITRARLQHGREGDIIRFADGHCVKVKNDWYVRIHKTIDRARFDRHIVELILHEEIDDVLALLPPHEATRVHDFYVRFSHQLSFAVLHYEQYWQSIADSQIDRKQYAKQFMPIVKATDPFAAAYVFGRFDNRNGREMILQHIEKHLFTNVKWAECAKWLTHLSDDK